MHANCTANLRETLSAWRHADCICNVGVYPVEVPTCPLLTLCSTAFSCAATATIASCTSCVSLQFVIPFLQPSFMYGDTSKTAQQQTITNVKEG